MEALGLNPGKKISEKMKISAAVSCRRLLSVCRLLVAFSLDGCKLQALQLRM